MRSGERTLADYNTLDFQKGYDWDGMKWERDTRAKTRLGEETITLRLARIEAERVVPWISVEDEDLNCAWALSEVSVRMLRFQQSTGNRGACRAGTAWLELLDRKTRSRSLS